MRKPPQRAATIASALAILFSSAVLAHARLTLSTPSDGANVSSPREIVLEFSEPVHVTAAALKTAAGVELAMGEIPEGPAESFAIPMTGTLEPGTFSLSWRAVSADTHIVSGEFSFVVTAGDTGAAGDASGASGDGDASAED